ncbi:MAG: DUF433 domain-containing protein [Deltaproteobacteria bacterium]|nr:DUF433 domain-containing protein [Deltaproteobacteria bacterium]
MLDRIKVDPTVFAGKPTILGLRITMDFVLKLLGDGYTADDIVREYPDLEDETIVAWAADESRTLLTQNLDLRLSSLLQERMLPP